jgi:hypothetical protein
LAFYYNRIISALQKIRRIQKNASSVVVELFVKNFHAKDATLTANTQGRKGTQ